MERGDVVVTNEYDVHKRRLLGVVIAPNPAGQKGIGVNWVFCPPDENFRNLHPNYDRYIDDPTWITVVGHIDLDAATAAQEGEKHGD